ncbi:double-strand break repair protein AddB [Aquicoccus sp. SCR17]|nr:double-strand break repair protein AddB [Carideicomes alvinocaridis]
MFDPQDRPRVFALAPGVDFPHALVEGLRARMRGQPPEAMARVTLIVNTARMARRITALFDEGAAGFLPRIRLLTDLGKGPDFADIPPAIAPLTRRLEIVELVSHLLEQSPDLAPRAHLFDLADSLARLMDEMQGEGVSPDDVAALDVTDQSGHWARAQQFLSIVAHYFDATAPDPDAEARQRRVVLRLAELWAAQPPTEPVILAGSTGSRGTTMRLMEAVAALPQGALVLPGFDSDMPGPAWDDLSDALTGEDHPQFRFARLLDRLSLSRDAVLPWHDAPPPAPLRNKVLSLALRPAPVTDCWLAEGPALGDVGTAFEGVTLLQAPTRREEALAIALRLRKAAEEGQSAALITPDRMLSREVTAALDRWQILPDDSAGVPLQLTPAGRFLRHVSQLFLRATPVSALLEMLKHPLTHTGAARNEHLLLTRDLELHLRRNGPPYPDAQSLMAWAASHKHEMAEPWAAWVAATICAAPPIGPLTLADWLERHLALAERIAGGSRAEGAGELWAQTSGEKSRATIEALAEAAAPVGEIGARDYADLFGAVLSRETLRDPNQTPHPNIRIWGTLEARVQGADLMILGGLNEGTWPEFAEADPWLNRQLRHRAGLLLPERRIGLSAHDFQQAASAPEVWITRAAKSDDAETVPSRWLNRLTNLLAGLPGQSGPQALDAMKDRGDEWLARAAALEAPGEAAPARRPSPRPPLPARPRQLYVTAIRDLIRDPYAIYAKHVLRLRPLDPLDQAPDALLRGIVFHSALEDFVKASVEDPSQLTPDALLGMARRQIDANVPWPTARTLWQARIARVAEWFVETERARQSRARPAAFETVGARSLTEPEFTLKGRADRIDIDDRGYAHVYDYKTGKPPSASQQAAFEKQLLLLAAIGEARGFEGIETRGVEAAQFIGIGSKPEEVPAPLGDHPAAQVWAEFAQLVAGFADPATGYTARRALFSDADRSDYDHLARLGEWDVTDDPAPEDLT